MDRYIVVIIHIIIYIITGHTLGRARSRAQRQQIAAPAPEPGPRPDSGRAERSWPVELSSSRRVLPVPSSPPDARPPGRDAAQGQPAAPVPLRRRARDAGVPRLGGLSVITAGSLHTLGPPRLAGDRVATGTWRALGRARRGWGGLGLERQKRAGRRWKVGGARQCREHGPARPGPAGAGRDARVTRD
jgi:hypothetical protein